MHIRIVHQYFRTPEDGGSQRSYLIARELIRNGFTVSIITATNEKKARLVKEGNMEIHYLPVYYSNHLSFKSRIMAFFRYVWLTIKEVRRLPRADFNYVISTPLTTGIIGIYGKYFLGTPYIFEAGDLWPAAPIELGILKNPVLKSAAEWLERISYRNASLRIGLSPPISEHMERISGHQETITITNFADPETLIPVSAREDVYVKYNIPADAFIITYAGTVGLANHLEYLVDLELAIPAEWNIWFIVMGDGAQKERINQYAKKLGAQRITFLEKGDRQKVADVLSASNALYVSFKKAGILQTGSPNKFFDALAIGKMVILNFGGWLSELCNTENIGFSYDPEDPHEAVQRLREYLAMPSAGAEAGERARVLGKQRYTAAQQLSPLMTWLRKKEKAGKTGP